MTKTVWHQLLTTLDSVMCPQRRKSVHLCDSASYHSVDTLPLSKLPVKKRAKSKVLQIFELPVQIEPKYIEEFVNTDLALESYGELFDAIVCQEVLHESDSEPEEFTIQGSENEAKVMSAEALDIIYKLNHTSTQIT